MFCKKVQVQKDQLLEQQIKKNAEEGAYVEEGKKDRFSCQVHERVEARAHPVLFGQQEVVKY